MNGRLKIILASLLVFILILPSVFGAAQDETFDGETAGNKPDDTFYTYDEWLAGTGDDPTSSYSNVSDIRGHTGSTSYLLDYLGAGGKKLRTSFNTTESDFSNITFFVYVNSSQTFSLCYLGENSSEKARIAFTIMTNDGISGDTFNTYVFARQNNSPWVNTSIRLEKETWLQFNITITGDYTVGGTQDKYTLNVYNGTKWNSITLWFNIEGSVDTLIFEASKQSDEPAAMFIDDIYINSVYAEEPAGVPVNSEPHPTNGETGVSINLNQYNVTVNDPNGDTMHTYLYTNTTVDGSWFSWKNTSGLSNGTVAWIGSHDGYGNFLGMGSGDLNYSTKYWWSVNTTDGNGNWDNDTYYFTTGPAPPSPAITVDKVANVSTVGAGNTSVMVNYTIWVNNTGNVNFEYVLINDTKFNCSCHDFYEESGNWSTNATEGNGFTISHESCYRVFNYSGWLNESETLKFWYSKRIFNCTGVEYGNANNTVNVTAGAASDDDYWNIVWGDAPVAPAEEQALVDVVIPFLWILTILMIVTGLVETFKRF